MRTLLLAVLVAATPAAAVELFVNGVNVEGLTGQRFEKVNVRIDDKGNIWIDAPGYSVKRVTAAPDRDPGVVLRDTPAITRRYFLVSEQNVPGMTEYDIDVYINGRLIRSLHSTEEQIVTEVTKYLKPGKNTVIFQAKKSLASPDNPRSVSKTHVFRAIVGEGVMGPDQVIIENPVITFSRTAADMNDVAQEFSLVPK